MCIVVLMMLCNCECCVMLLISVFLMNVSVNSVLCSVNVSVGLIFNIVKWLCISVVSVVLVW